MTKGEALAKSRWKNIAKLGAVAVVLMLLPRRSSEQAELVAKADPHDDSNTSA